ncbi:hypothetical protein IAR55_003339 [Kwoniella newhampshirensis]|uniref:Exostosin GT47 domain-containing protein n=1 Tax=Kwoniella newhampshirensis TaxID=1651941 RepID=A0AAW0YZ97_9TREE
MVPIQYLIASLRKPRFLALVVLFPILFTFLYRSSQDPLKRPNVRVKAATQGGSWEALAGIGDEDWEDEAGWGMGVGDWLKWNKQDKKSILVTGGAGQLGQAIIPGLLDNEFDVHVFDIAPRPSTMPKAVNYHRGSFAPPDSFASLFASNTFYGVIHLAGISLEAWCKPKESECLDVNAGSTEALMTQVEALLARKRAGSRWGVSDAPWIIMGSSMEVYGPDGVDENSEKKPNTALGRTKLAAEQKIENALVRQSTIDEEPRGLHVMILRFSQVYGFPQAYSIPESSISSLLVNALTSLPIQYSSDTLPVDLLHVEDAVDGIFKALSELERQAANDEPNRLETVNLVTGVRRLTEEIVELVRTETHSMSPVRDIGDHHAPRFPNYSPAKAAQVLGWTPKIGLASGLGIAVTELSEEIATYSRGYLHEHCAPTVDFPALEGEKATAFVEDERNRDLTRLDGCTVNMGFDHDGWLHHVKCEDGKHCTADGQKVTAMNWNQSVFIVRKVRENRFKERTVRVAFEEEKGMGYLGLSKKEGGDVGLELFKENTDEAQIHFDVQVQPDASYLRLLIPDSGKQLHAVANVTNDQTRFSLESTAKFTEPPFDLRMNVLCCPSEGNWPLLLDDSRQTVSQVTGNTPQMWADAKGPKTSLHPHDWAYRKLPACWNDCDSPTICVQTGDCKCVQADHCHPKRQNPLIGLHPPAAESDESTKSHLGALAGYSHALVKAVQSVDWRDVLLPAARDALAAHPGFIKVHVADGYEGQEAIEAAPCHKLQKTHCFSADHVMYEALRAMSVPAEEAQLVVLPVYQQCKDQPFLLHDVMHHAAETIPGVKTGEKTVALVMTHDWGICISFAWEIWSARDKNTLYPDWILDNVLVWSVMGDYDSPCYRPHQDVVVPARTCRSNTLRQTFPTVDDIKPMRNRPNLLTWSGTYWGTGKSDRLRLTCPRGGAGQRELIRGGGAQSNFESWDYMNDLNNARFCPQPRGIAGWSPRTNDAIYAGCIPVLIAEGSHYPFATFLDWSKFSVRVAPTELDRIEEILAAIPLSKVEEMQANLVSIREAFLYSTDENPEEELKRRGPLFFAMHEAGLRLRTRYPINE